MFLLQISAACFWLWWGRHNDWGCSLLTISGANAAPVSCWHEHLFPHAMNRTQVMDLAECKPFSPVFLLLFAGRVLTQIGSLIYSTAQLHNCLCHPTQAGDCRNKWLGKSMLCFHFIAVIRYEDREPWSYHGKELLWNFVWRKSWSFPDRKRTACLVRQSWESQQWCGQLGHPWE